MTSRATVVNYRLLIEESYEKNAKHRQGRTCLKTLMSLLPILELREIKYLSTKTPKLEVLG